MNNEDLAILKKMRQVFLADRESSALNYWENVEHIALYEKFFARRIAWKWHSVLEELNRVEWRIPPHINCIIDWGCGSGVAAETVLNVFPETTSLSFYFIDRSPIATGYSAKKLAMSHPTIKTLQNQMPTKLSAALLIVSHVLTELSPSQRQSLFELATQCAAVIWVEPGTQFCANALVDFREIALKHHQIVSPCFHQQPCGLLLPENERHWCHFFGASPTHVFHDAEWRMFSRELEIDLRSLPVSWMVTEKKPINMPITVPNQCVNHRVLARPRPPKRSHSYYCM
jgi:ribosomal protein RSM22 (predicted rRNA methylase)